VARSRGGSNGIEWDTKKLEASLAVIEPRIMRGLAVTGAKTASDGEAWMKSNAPWNDVTGNARNGLRGRYTNNKFQHRVTFSHTVDYGIWLEVRFDGRNAIVLPAVERFAVQWASLLNRLLIGS
jgi:hypothetical protein